MKEQILHHLCQNLSLRQEKMVRKKRIKQNQDSLTIGVDFNFCISREHTFDTAINLTFTSVLSLSLNENWFSYMTFRRYQSDMTFLNVIFCSNHEMLENSAIG